MRAFDPHRLFLDVDAAVDDDFVRAHHLLGGGIVFLHPQGAMAVPFRRPVRDIVMNDIDLAVAIEQQRGIDAVEAEPHRIGPRPGRILGGDEEIAAAGNASVDDGEGAVVITELRCVETARDFQLAEIDLARPVDGVAHLRPVHQILGMEHRQAGEVHEARIDQVIILADAHDARIGVIALPDRIQILLRPGLLDVVDRVMAVIGKPVDHRDGGSRGRRRRRRRGRGRGTSGQ